MFVDTHCHIFEPEFDADRGDAMDRALGNGVGKFLLPAIDGEGYDRMLSFAAQWATCAFPAMGLHPTSVTGDRDWRSDLERVEKYLFSSATRFHAIGEIGLDLHWTSDTLDFQREVLSAQLDWAVRLDLPVCIHTRDAWREMYDMILQYRGRGLRGVFHAFSSDADMARRLLGCGEFLFGIGGAVTYRHSSMADFIPAFGIERTVLETDCPYLTPVPHRGERNEPSFIPLIAKKIAELSGLDIRQVEQVTTRSAERMFDI